MATQNVEERLSALEAQVLELRQRLQAPRPSVVGRTRPDFRDTMFGVHANSSLFAEVTREIEAERKREREEAPRLLAEDEA